MANGEAAKEDRALHRALCKHRAPHLIKCLPNTNWKLPFVNILNSALQPADFNNQFSLFKFFCHFVHQAINFSPRSSSCELPRGYAWIWTDVVLLPVTTKFIFGPSLIGLWVPLASKLNTRRLCSIQ